MAIINNTNKQQMLARMWGKATLLHCWWECKLIQLLWKALWRSLKKIKNGTPYYPEIPLLGIYQKEHAPGYDRATCTPMFIAALVTIAILWKQPRCPMTDEWIKKMWYIYTVEFYSAIKENEIMLFAGKWMELENFMLSKVSQAQKVKGHMFSLICGS
jgi:hypothetical protein